jgi:hypothetical protein
VVLAAYRQHLNGWPIEIERYLARAPNTLKEAFQELNRLLSTEEKEDFMGKPEVSAVAFADFGLSVFV